MTSEGRFFWSRDRTEQLISLYREMPELWDLDHPGYRDRSGKQASTERLANHFSATEQEINRKIHNLRNQMSQEVRKIRESGEYGGKWPHFDSLTFILPALFTRSAASGSGHSKFKDRNILEINCDVKPNIAQNHEFDDTQQLEMNPWRMQVKRSLSPQEDQDYRIFNRIQDEWDIFGQFVASELRQMRTDGARKSLKRTIQKAILDASESEDFEERKTCVCGQQPDSSDR